MNRTIQHLNGLGAAELLVVPEVAFLLLASGVLAVNIWLAHPHLALAALGGPILIICGITSAAAMPTSAAFWYFMLLAAGSFLLEVLSLPGMLLHALGGTVALILAGLCLHEPWIGAHAALAVPVALLVGLGTYVAARRSWRLARIDPFHVSTRLVGREAVILSTDVTSGHAVIAGAVWPVQSISPLRSGDTVTVTAYDGDHLLVTRAGGRRDRTEGRREDGPGSGC